MLPVGAMLYTRELKTTNDTVNPFERSVVGWRNIIRDCRYMVGSKRVTSYSVPGLMATVVEMKQLELPAVSENMLVRAVMDGHGFIVIEITWEEVRYDIDTRK